MATTPSFPLLSGTRSQRGGGEAWGRIHHAFALPSPYRPVHPLARAVSDLLAEPQTERTARSLLSVQVDNAVPERISAFFQNPSRAGFARICGKIELVVGIKLSPNREATSSGKF